MGSAELVDEALKLKPEDRFLLIETLLRSLDQPDPALDAIGADEAERRLAACRAGTVEGIPAEQVSSEP